MRILKGRSKAPTEARARILAGNTMIKPVQTSIAEGKSTQAIAFGM
jgi:hypothetical protein